ncbi:MAG: carboxypeptidase regulatory-like domain-containing protein, partial [Vicinamibacterales bacterium]
MRRPFVLSILLFVLCTALPAVASGQETVTIRGHVIEGLSRVAIPGATIRAGDTTATTGADGRFTLQTRAGTVTLTFEAPGHLAESRELTLTAGAPAPDIEVVLFNVQQFTETVTVGGESKAPLAELPPARVEVTPLQVNAVAGAVDNVFRVIQTLPGVSAADEIGSRLVVRGGSPDQNLTMMDGVEVHNPYRLFGLFSAFNPATVKSFELSAGGFGPKYGDRLSSLLTVENRPGTEKARLTGSGALAITDGNVVLEGKLPGTSTGSWLLTGRRTYYDLLVGPLLDQKLPSFADVQTIFSWLPRQGQRVSVTAIRSRENTDATFDDEETSETIAIQSGASNDLASLSFFTTAGRRGSSRTILSWYRNNEQLGVNGQVVNEAKRSNTPGTSAFANVAFTRDLLLRDIALREEYSFAASDRHGIEAGGDLHLLDTGWAWRITGDRNSGEANGSSIQGGAGLPAILDSTRIAKRASLWLSDRWVATSRLTLQPGVRLDWNDISKEMVLGPRVSAALDLGSGYRARGAAGLYTQSPGYEKQIQADYFVDLSDTSTVRLRSERSWHAIAGVEKDLG